MKITNLPIDKLKPYAQNVRIHSEAQIEQLCKSIKEFHWTQPIVVDDQHNILAGHARYEAAKRMNEAAVPCVVLSGLSESQIKAYRIIDNKLAADSEWNFETLALELEELQALEYDLETFDLATLVADATKLGGEKEKDADESKENLENYLANKVNQIVLYFDNETYAAILDKLNAIQTEHHVQSNTDAFLVLLSYYENNHSK